MKFNFTQLNDKVKKFQPSIVSFFTGVIALLTLLMWCETSRSVEVAKNFYESTNRPYIIFNDSYVTLDDNIQWLNIQCNFKNIGNMPSRDFLFNFYFKFKNNFYNISKISPDFTSIYPSQITDYYYQINDYNFVLLCRTDSLSSISIEVNYNGPSEESHYQTTAFFTPSGREFYKLSDTVWE